GMIISQILVIAYWLAKIFINAINHNKPLNDGKPIKYNVWSAIATTIIGVTVLYYGKFWDCLLDKM
uniref:hypothetical protein n=2 Tax=Phascolarctobacterium succinatutens TaxID=626940 RepID=UPI003AF7ADBE